MASVAIDEVTGAKAQKATVDGDRLVIELYHQGTKRWLVVDNGHLSVLDAKPARDAGDGDEAGGSATIQGVVRKELVPSLLAAVERREPVVRFTFARHDARPRALLVEACADARAVVVAETEEGLRVLGVVGPPRPVDGRDLRRGRLYEFPRDPKPLTEGAAAPAAATPTTAPRDEHAEALAAARAALRAEAKRLRRLVEALARDLERHGEAARHEEEGELLKTALARIKRGDASVDVVDWHGEPRTLTLDPKRDPRANLEERFKRARRSRAAAAQAQPRLEQAKARLADVEDARAALNDATAGAALSRAQALLARPESGGSARRKAAKAGRRKSWRAFRVAGDVVVRVGRGARENDDLVRSARGNDLWLHARERQGAHVVVPSNGGDVDSELLIDAAHLAAHFSSARGEERVDVQHARVKHLKKGGAPGLVYVHDESVLQLRVDKERLRRLLDAEAPP